LGGGGKPNEQRKKSKKGTNPPTEKKKGGYHNTTSRYNKSSKKGKNISQKKTNTQKQKNSHIPTKRERNQHKIISPHREHLKCRKENPKQPEINQTRHEENKSNQGRKNIHKKMPKHNSTRGSSWPTNTSSWGVKQKKGGRYPNSP